MSPELATPIICPYDRQPIAAADRVMVCPACKRAYHEECWKELGGCAVYGCVQMVEIKKSQSTLPTFWGSSEKTCPVCAEKIPVADLECRYCKTVFNDVRPISRESVLPPPPNPRAKALRADAIRLLVFNLLGVTSPIALLLGSIWYRRNRQEIERAGSTVKALSLIGLAAGALYVVIIAVGLIVFLLFNPGQP